MRIRVLPYKQGSKSAKALSVALGGKVLKLTNSRYTPKQGDVVVNWGNSKGVPATGWGTSARVLNLPEVILTASNKLTFFKQMAAENLPHFIPEFYTEKENIPSDSYPILARTILSGHSGAGIRWCSNPDDVPDAPLYVKYIKKSDEYRVHLFRAWNGEVGLIQRKARRADHYNPNWQIRNHANGFIYQREGFECPPSVVEAAKACFDVTGLDFGAVDVVYNKHYGTAYVLEINTAPGLEGSTVNDYDHILRSLM